MSSLKGKTALVTGSTSGIGLGMAIALAKQGANIMMNGFGEKDEAIAKIKACGVEVDYHGADTVSRQKLKTSFSRQKSVLVHWIFW
jgi:3-hydroxybutyrate dehydrogenase